MNGRWTKLVVGAGSREMNERRYFVYIMSNKSRTLYTGVTNSLQNRVWQHKLRRVPGFTQRYNVTRLVYFEEFGDIRLAIAREKQIKGWLRSKKLAMILAMNPQWADLSMGWYENESWRSDT